MKETWSLLGFVIVVAPILFLLIGMYVLDYLHDRREKKSLKELSNQQQ
jgi:cytochrome c-type biogenesis protein CcmH/NrfF